MHEHACLGILRPLRAMHLAFLPPRWSFAEGTICAPKGGAGGSGKSRHPGVSKTGTPASEKVVAPERLRIFDFISAFKNDGDRFSRSGCRHPY